jgi:phospholipid transport system substrate-binding protein
MRILTALFLACLSLSFIPAVSANTPTPTQVIKTAVEQVISVLQEKDGVVDERWQRISLIIARNFDFQSMSQSVLATHWKKATPEEQRQFADYFSQYLENVYRSRIESYSNQAVRYTGESVKDNKAIVNTFIVTDTAEIPVTYKLKLDNGKWAAYDMLIEEVSLVNSYRTTFSSIVQSEGMDGLLNDLQRKIAKYKAQKEAPQATP